jgi:hypothetical protein
VRADATRKTALVLLAFGAFMGELAFLIYDLYEPQRGGMACGRSGDEAKP